MSQRADTLGGAARRWRRGPLLVAAYLLGSTLSALLAANPTDLDAFFIPSARLALEGHPLQIYSVRHDAIYPNANGPLSLLPLTGATWVASLLGRLDDPLVRRMVVMAIFAIFNLLLAREAVAAIERRRGEGLAGRRRLLLLAVFATPPLLWHSTLMYGHVEQPLCLWLVLIAARATARGRAAGAGTALGLAILARSAAVLYLVPLALASATRRRAAAFAGSAALVVAAGLAPFLIATPGDTVFSLSSYREALPIGGGSIWELAGGTGLEPLVRRWDGLLVLLVAALACGLVAALGRARRVGRPSAESNTMGLLALSAVTLPLLIRTVWPYYLLDAYVLGTVWVLGRPLPWPAGHRRAVLAIPLLISGFAMLAEVGVASWASGSLRQAESLAMFALLLTLAGYLIGSLLRARGLRWEAGPGSGPGRSAPPWREPTPGEPAARVRPLLVRPMHPESRLDPAEGSGSSPGRR